MGEEIRKPHQSAFRRRGRSAARLLGLAILGLLLWRIDLRHTAQLLAGAEWRWYAASILAIPLILFLKSLRWEALLVRQGLGLGLRRAARLYLAASLVGVLTPGRLGDFIKALYLRRRGCSMGQSLWSPLVDRLADLVVLSLFGLWGLGYFSLILPDDPAETALTLAGVGGVLVLGLFIARKLLRGGAANLAERFAPAAHKAEARRSAEEFSAQFRLLRPAFTLKIALLTLLAFAAQYVQAWCVARALTIDIALLPLAACVAVMTLAVILPISIQGIGTRDAALVALFHTLGLSAPQALAFSALTLANNVLAVTVCLWPYWTVGRDLVREEDEEEAA